MKEYTVYFSVGKNTDSVVVDAYSDHQALRIVESELRKLRVSYSISLKPF